MVDAINQTGAAWASYFWMLNWQNSLFVAIALLLMHRYRRAHPRFGRIVGIIALVKLLTPLFIPAGQAISDSLSFGYFGDTVVVAGENAPAETPKLSLSGSLFLLWLGGAALMLAMIIRRYFHLLHLARNAVPMPDSTLKTGTFPNVFVCRSQKEHSPFVIGFFRFQIVFPRSAASWPAEQIRAAFAHEIAHIKLYDHWINLAQALVQSIYFLNPLVWLLNRQLNDTREITCDEAAVAFLQQTPAGYARSLIDIAAKLTLPQTLLLTPLFFAASSRNLKQRVSYQLAQKENPAMKKWTLRHIVIALSLALLVFPLSCDYQSEMPGDVLNNSTEAPVREGDSAIFQLEDLTEPPDWFALYDPTDREEYVQRIERQFSQPVQTAANQNGEWKANVVNIIFNVLVGLDGMPEKVEIDKISGPLDQRYLDKMAKNIAHFNYGVGKREGVPVKYWMKILRGVVNPNIQ